MPTDATAAVLLGHTPAAAPIVRLVAPPGGRTFTAAGQPHRVKAITAFNLHRRFADGEDVTPFLRMMQDHELNQLRGFLYTPAKFWHADAWNEPSIGACEDFADLLASYGFYWELCYVTDDRQDAAWLAATYAHALDRRLNILHELVNEPSVGAKADLLDVGALACPWTNGEYDRKARIRGTYGVDHTPRDREWARKAKNLEERFAGGGPDAPSDPKFPYPWVADEPGKPGSDVPADPPSFVAYFAIASAYGGGTYHYESGKLGKLPQTPDEWACLKAAAQGLNAFPVDVTRYPYVHDKADETTSGSLRTYRWGPYGVRVPSPDRPLTAPVLMGV